MLLNILPSDVNLCLDLITGYEGEFVTEDTLLTSLDDVGNLGDIDMDLLEFTTTTHTQQQTAEFLTRSSDLSSSDFDNSLVDISQEPVEFSIQYEEALVPVQQVGTAQHYLLYIV